MTTSPSWRLKRYGRCIPDSTGGKQWKVFEANDNGPEMFLTIVKSGYLLVLQGQESLDTIPFLGGSVKVQHKSENLIFRYTVNGESRVMRMQLDGAEECARAVAELKKYVSVTTQDATPPPPPPSNQPPAEASAPAAQEKVEVEPEVVTGSLTIRRLTQHILGESAVTLPQAYRDPSQAPGDLEPVLRLCLLDPGFPAFVESVEDELRKLLEG
ncbi:meiotic recombination protein REC114 [Pseudoliparis swirei]|uniref:meiotic recombination protein REC114 n=1 Tax=Pseudoliparis swirei TaxID=2059687 RepID=UPI0024BE9650|nr:meiotic recombination protein REC114 [Pseudoliparis swirei]